MHGINRRSRCAGNSPWLWWLMVLKDPGTQGGPVVIMVNPYVNWLDHCPLVSGGNNGVYTSSPHPDMCGQQGLLPLDMFWSTNVITDYLVV